ncbi:PqqD family protein [Mucilaginibacter lappiensis]|uniref:Coenzyme PQQ synthesis protein D (PqqD) n=1 Tax=Mucilaginibacter lappiensis TaxID=354630 RepID=A0A841JPT8_9SPHI|nr:PqqD family protein [Mucilaginibacter lappiensis]MBB6130778.1 hypothetical protein [Mucilaginibacter lappiensis]
MRLKSELILRQLGDDYVIVEPEQDMVDFSRVYTLNESAAWVWSQLQSEEFTLETVVNILWSRYNLNQLQKEQIAADALKLVNLLKENGLLYDI